MSLTDTQAPGGAVMKVLALVGVYRADFNDPRHHDHVEPTVAGVLPDHAWQYMTDDEVNEHWAKTRPSFDPSGVDYDWREIWIELDPASLRAHFEVPAVAGVVAPPSTPERQSGAPAQHSQSGERW